jgi:tRNA-2-methylthio-N6-dimethylallyladenosine synthase
LQDLLSTQQRAFNDSMRGRVLPVLFERLGRNEGQLIGRSPYLQSVFVTADRSLLGTVANVNITIAQQNSLGGEVTQASAEPAFG